MIQLRLVCFEKRVNIVKMDIARVIYIGRLNKRAHLTNRSCTCVWLIGGQTSGNEAIVRCHDLQSSKSPRQVISLVQKTFGILYPHHTGGPMDVETVCVDRDEALDYAIKQKKRIDITEEKYRQKDRKPPDSLVSMAAHDPIGRKSFSKRCFFSIFYSFLVLRPISKKRRFTAIVNHSRTKSFSMTSQRKNGGNFFLLPIHLSTKRARFSFTPSFTIQFVSFLNTSSAACVAALPAFQASSYFILSREKFPPFGVNMKLGYDLLPSTWPAVNSDGVAKKEKIYV